MDNLIIKSNITPGVIEFNIEAIKENIKQQIAEFDGSVFTEESIQSGKRIVANLRKRQKEAKDADKQVKEEYMKPYNDFHAKVLELVDMVEQPIGDITSQLDEMEEKRKEEKRATIEEIYRAEVSGFEDYLPLEKIYDSRWENKTTTVSSIKEDIKKVVDSTAQAINTISAMNSECIEDALNRYKSDLSLVNAIAYVNDYEQKKADILAREKAKQAEEEECKHQEELERAREEERRKIREEERAAAEREAEIQRAREEERQRIEAEQEQARQEEMKVMEVKKTESSTSVVNYKIIATDEEFDMIEMYLNSIGVEFIKGDF